MHTTGFERMALAKVFVAAWVAFFGVAIEHAQAQPVNPVPPPPPPVFNPSSPNTVPQPRETPVSPGMPSALPGSSGAFSPSVGITPSADAHPHRRAVTSTTVRSNVAKARGGRDSHRHHRLSGSRGSDGTAAGPNYYTPSYYFPFGWGHGWYSCVWHREWDGEWFHDCI